MRSGAVGWTILGLIAAPLVIGGLSGGLGGAVGFLLLAVLILAGAGVYLLPTIVAAANKAPNAGLVFFLNLFIGWTVIGWFATLFWAFAGAAAARTAEREVTAEIVAFAASHKKCPRCAELVKAEALACRYCGQEFPSPLAIPANDVIRLPVPASPRRR